MKLDTKLKKKIKKKLKKIIFREKKTQKNLEILFFGKMKKSEKNNPGKCAIFFYQKQIGKTEKSKFLDIFVHFICLLKSKREYSVN